VSAVVAAVNTPSATASGATIASRNVIEVVAADSSSSSFSSSSSSSVAGTGPSESGRGLGAAVESSCQLSYIIASSNAGITFPSLQSSLQVSLTSGAFQKNLRSFAKAAGAIALLNVTVDVQGTNFKDLNIATGGGGSSSASGGMNTLTLIIIAGAIIVGLGVVWAGYQVRKIYCKTRDHPSGLVRRSYEGRGTDDSTLSAVGHMGHNLPASSHHNHAAREEVHRRARERAPSTLQLQQPYRNRLDHIPPSSSQHYLRQKESAKGASPPVTAGSVHAERWAALAEERRLREEVRSEEGADFSGDGSP
jgi:hypothetical protein